MDDGNVFAIGDCAAHCSHPLPALAQVASQQGKYLSHILNTVKTASNPNESISTTESFVQQLNKLPKFRYSHLGSMASVGSWKGVVDTSAIENVNQVVAPVKGFWAFLLWRAAYWTKQVSFVNKILIPMYWLKATVFGRDISRF